MNFGGHVIKKKKTNKINGYGIEYYTDLKEKRGTSDKVKSWDGEKINDFVVTEDI